MKQRHAGPRRKIGIDAADVQVEVRVDAVRLEPADEEIEPVDLRGVERPQVCLPETLRRGVAIHVMKAHAIDAELRKMRRDFFRLFVRRKIGRKRQIHAHEAHAPATLRRVFIGLPQMAVGREHRAARAGGTVVPRADVGDARRRVIPRNHEGEQGRRRLIGLRRNGESQSNRSTPVTKETDDHARTEAEGLKHARTTSAPSGCITAATTKIGP